MSKHGTVPLRLDQDLGDNFQFQEDQEALLSILENRGLPRAQNYEELSQKCGLVPAGQVPRNFQGADKLEFFQSANGRVFFRRKLVSPRERFATEMENNKSTPSMHPVRTLRVHSSQEKAASGRTVSPENRSKPPPRRDLHIQSERKGMAGPAMPALYLPRQSISELKQPPKHASSLLPKPVSVARKALHFGGHKDAAAATNNTEFKKPLAPLAENRLLPPLTQLTRESLQYIPRESLSLLAQLPRESATYAELERQLMDEDDTQSFEALEMMLKTPRRPGPKSAVILNCGEQLPAVDGCSTTPASLDQPAPPPLPISDCEVVLRPGPTTIAEELANLPAEPALSSTSVISRSCSSLLTGPDVTVRQSVSEENLSNIVHLSDLVCSERLDQVLADLERYRQERDQLEQQQKELMEKIRQRKADFKELWGVSPMSISRMKTARRPPPPLTGAVLANVTNTVGRGGGTRAFPKEDVNKKTKDAMGEEDVTGQENICPPGGQEEARRVRFDSGNNLEKFLTPDSSFQATPVSPVRSNNSCFSNQSFASLKSTFSFLQTPSIPASKKRFHMKFSMTEEEEEEDSVPRDKLLQASLDQRLGVPTPVALRCLSNRVREEFALLYAEEPSEAIAKTLTFAQGST